MVKMLQRLTTNLGGGFREETLEGRNHLVCNAAILAEGVWTGSNGPLFYREKNLAKSVPSWNHKPLVVNHPKDKKGKMISACDPWVINNRKIGIILNTDYDDKLRTETWIDEEKANGVDKRIVSRVRAGQLIECSTGVYTENIKKPGTWNSTDYEEEATELAPDHLAVLLDKLGAYSIRDGGGILQANTVFEPESTLQVLHHSAVEHLKRLGISLDGNELSYGVIASQISDLLRLKFGEPGRYWHGCLHEVYSDHVIFSMDTPEPVLYKIGYEVSDDSVSLVGESSEVSRVVEYRSKDNETYAANSAGQLVLQTMEEEMSEKFNRVKHIASLIGAGWEEKDRADLEKTPDSVLRKMEPVKTTNNEGPDDDDDADKSFVETRAAPSKRGIQSLEKLVQEADPETREAFKQIKQTARRQKAKAVVKITANTKDSDLEFKPKFFEDMTTETLEGIIRYGEICAEKALEDAGVESDVTGNDGSSRYFGSAGFRRVAANQQDDKPDDEVLTTSSFTDDDE